MKFSICVTLSRFTKNKINLEKATKKIFKKKTREKFIIYNQNHTHINNQRTI